MTRRAHFLDPSLILVIGCILLPILDLNSTDERIAFLSHPFTIASIFLLLVTVMYTSYMSALYATCPLSDRELLQSIWWIFNGVVTHFTMGGLQALYFVFKVPTYHLHKMMSLIDSRFATDDPATLFNYGFELFVMSSLSIAMYYATRTRAHWRTPLQLVISTIQLMGAVSYVGTEWLYGFKHIPWYDHGLEFSTNHIIYFWIGFVSNIIWIIIPLMLIHDAWVEIVGIITLNIDNVVSIGQKEFMFSPAAFHRRHSRGSISNNHIPPIPFELPHASSDSDEDGWYATNTLDDGEQYPVYDHDDSDYRSHQHYENQVDTSETEYDEDVNQMHSHRGVSHLPPPSPQPSDQAPTRKSNKGKTTKPEPETPRRRSSRLRRDADE